MNYFQRKLNAFFTLMPVILIALGLFFIGLFMRYPHPALVSYPQLLKLRPTSGRFAVSGAKLDPNFKIVRTTGNTHTYYAMRGVNESPTAPAHVLFLPDVSQRSWAMAPGTVLEGMIDTPSDGDYRDLANYNRPHDQTVLILNSQEIPSWLTGLVVVCVGLILGVIGRAWRVRSTNK